MMMYNIMISPGEPVADPRGLGGLGGLIPGVFLFVNLRAVADPGVMGFRPNPRRFLFLLVSLKDSYGPAFSRPCPSPHPFKKILGPPLCMTRR